MTYPIVAWHEEHVYFSGLLDLFERELEALRSQGAPNYELMLDVVAYLGAYGDELHHPREDEAFRRLARRCPDLELEVARLRQEHRALAAAGEALGAHLSAIVCGALVPREVIAAAADTYLAYYRGHLAAEEEVILPRALRMLLPEDWEAIRRAVPAERGPAGSPGHFTELRRRIALSA
jgi:hemerythrin-like domain-containing protein